MPHASSARIERRACQLDRILEKNTLWIKKRACTVTVRARDVRGFEAHGSAGRKCTIRRLKGLLVPLGQQTILKRGARAATPAVAAATHTKPWPC